MPAGHAVDVQSEFTHGTSSGWLLISNNKP
jgi:hypothetical protein